MQHFDVITTNIFTNIFQLSNQPIQPNLLFRTVTIATSQATMGGGEHKEAVLVTLPMQEPHDAIERLQKKFPHLKITYQNVSWTKDRAQLEKEVDKGTIIPDVKNISC